MLCSIRKCHRCKRFKSLRTGSFFEASKLPLQQHVQFLWKWSQRGSLSLMSAEGIASRKTLVKMSRNCREVAWRALILHPIPTLGGPGVIVQIDESKFNHKSKVCSDNFCTIPSERIKIVCMIKRVYATSATCYILLRNLLSKLSVKL